MRTGFPELGDPSQLGLRRRCGTEELPRSVLFDEAEDVLVLLARDVAEQLDAGRNTQLDRPLGGGERVTATRRRRWCGGDGKR